MSLKSEIENGYIDTYGLVAPYVTRRDQRGSDNGVLYSSEYYILLKLLGEATEQDESHWAILMYHCMVVPGLIGRVPGDTGQSPPDDIYGVLAGAKVLNYPVVAELILDYGKAHYGFFNNANPNSIRTKDGSIAWEALLWRQLQMWYATLVAANKKRWYHFPLAWFTSLVLIYSCSPLDQAITYYVDDANKDIPKLKRLKTSLGFILKQQGIPTHSADPRRLSWLLIKTVEDSSWLCKLAALLWKRRLIKDYGDEGMIGVAKQYYQKDPLHPFIKYMVKV